MISRVCRQRPILILAYKKHFPADFMFQLSEKELEDWKSQIAISNKEKMGLRKRPNVFTEQGVAMLSSVFLKNNQS